MTTIEEDGFLSGEASTRVSAIHAAHPDWFRLVVDMNRFAMRVLGSVKVDQSSEENIYAAAYYGRVIFNAQAAVVVAERGMVSQAEAMCRATFDSLFTLGALVRRPGETIAALVADDQYNRTKDLRASRRSMADGRLELSEEETRDLERIEAELEAAQRRRMPICDQAVWAGLGELYDSRYRSLSKPAHSTIRDVERAFSLDASGLPTSIWWGPKTQGVDGVLLPVAESIRLACAFAGEAFGADLGSDFVELRRRYEELMREKPPAVTR